MKYVIVFITLSVIVPGGLLISQSGIQNVLTAIPALILVFYSAARLATLSRNSVTKIAQITFWVFVYVFLALSPSLQILYSKWSWPYRYDSGLVVEAYVLIFLGLAAYEIGIRYGHPPLLGSSDWLSRLFARRIGLVRVLITTMFALVVVPYLIYELGGVALLIASRNERFDLLVEATIGDNQAKLQGLYTLIAVVPMVSAIVLMQFMLRFSALRQTIRWPHVLALVLITLLCVAINNPVSSARYIVGTMVLWALFAYVYERRVKGEWLALVLASSLIFLFPLADAFRISLDPSDSIYYAESVVVRLTEKPDFDAFQQVLNAIVYVSERGISWGNQLLGTLGFWVPRNLWLAKPVSTGSLVAEYQAYEYTNLSLPLWGELFVDGSYVLVIAGFFGYGWTTSRLEAFVRRQSSIQEYLTLGEVLLVAYSAYQIFILRGALLPAFAYFAPIAVLLFVCSTRAPIDRNFVGINVGTRLSSKATL